MKRLFKSYLTSLLNLRHKYAREYVRLHGFNWYFTHNIHFTLPESFDYFIEQSENYPYWWRKFDWWDWNEINPIYKKKYDKR